MCHCPSSNMRLASGIAPVKKYLEHGVKVGVGVDGSASNDASNMLVEVRETLLLARLKMGLWPPEGPMTLLSTSDPLREKEWMTAWRSAGLIQNYGKRAGIVLAARGVGPTTATRILRRHLGREDDLYLSVLRAERDFERTRMFWD